MIFSLKWQKGNKHNWVIDISWIIHTMVNKAFNLMKNIGLLFEFEFEF